MHCCTPPTQANKRAHRAAKLAMMPALLAPLAPVRASTWKPLPADQNPTIQARATPAQATPAIGVFFWHDSPNDRATFAGVKQGLAAAKVTVTFHERHADADAALARRQLTELRELDCALVLALGTRGTQLAQAHLPNLPIVFAAVTNPVTAGIVTKWSDSQPQLCGASNWIAPAGVLGVFQLAVPDLRRLGMLRSRTSGVVSAAELAGMQQFLQQADAPDIELHEVVVEHTSELPKAIETLRRQDVDAIWIPIDLTIYQNVPVIEKAMHGDHLPLLTTAAAGVRNGALVAAAVDYRLHGRRAAALVQKVLAQGAVPANLKVDRMQSSLVVVNLKAAQRNQIELPLSLLALADELIGPTKPQVARPPESKLPETKNAKAQTPKAPTPKAQTQDPR